ncbi:unnamed protein product [Phytophthora fragariaefolia]|uniref:Unnamed protein product n=1 Tax=Phytophthora fragariaefolia TaxID=1490495 RepID=A0A9W6XEF9_9STRA|nr:unnamed protein product [Phytophthora fragariaefolia]
MARGQSPLARAQARALRTLSAVASSPAASPETLVSVMAPPAATPGADDGSPSRPPLAGVVEASAPISQPTTSTGDASGVAQSLPRLDQTTDALSPALGAAPRSAADAPEAAFGAGPADSQPQGSVSSSGASGDGACSAADAPYHFLALARLVVDLNRRPPLRTDYGLDQRLEAAGSLSDVVEALAPIPRSPAPWEHELSELRDDVASRKARLAASEASLRREVELRLKAKCVCNQALDERNAVLETLRRLRLDHADAARQLVATNIALEQGSQAVAVLEQRCRRLNKSLADIHKVIRQERESLNAGLQSAIPPPPAASGSSEGSGPAPLASSGSLGGAAATSGSSKYLAVDSDASDDSGSIIPSALHQGKGKRPAKSSAKPRTAPSPPKRKQRLGRLSVDLKARKAAKQATPAPVSSGGPSLSVHSSLPAASVSTSSALVSGISASAGSDVLLFASIPSGSNPSFLPIPRTPASPASLTVSTASLPSTPVVSMRITTGTEASVPVEIEDDGGSEAGGAASEASVAPGGIFSSPQVSQPRRDGRPTRAASTTAGLRSMAAAENEAAPDALVLGLATPSHTSAATQASVASSASTPEPAESAAVVAAASAAVVTSASARRRVANTHMGPIPSARVVATPTPRLASALRARAVVTATLSTMHGTWSTAFEPVTVIPAPIQVPQPRVRASQKLPDLANPLLEPAFTAPGAPGALAAWC